MLLQSGNLSRLTWWWETAEVVESAFYTKLEKLVVQEQKKDKLFTDHVTQVCETHTRVIVSFLQQAQGGARPTTEGSREIGHNVHV